MKKFTYSDAGVNIKKVKKSHQKTWKQIMETFDLRKGKIGQPLKVFGHYAGLIDIGNNKVLALHTDGIGTKVLVSQVIEKYDTVGIDAVAMAVNDIICVGAEPIALVDYLAIQETNDKIIEEIMKGLVEGAKQANTVLIGGETAIMPDVITGVDNKGFDLAVTALGIVDKNKIVTGEKMKPGDIVIGLPSSGIHSNGLSLARKVLPKEYYKELLTPTKIYVKPILELIECCDVHGLANITGGASQN
jgi:phosphoribosylformylglycinamidine cyclo-ligase